MTREEALQIITSACVGANPEIKQRRFWTVRLSDVLLAISRYWYKDENEHWVFVGNEKQQILMLCAQWNLREDNLEAQSPETLQFLADLLKKV